jgi:hypothetical protein
LITGSEKGKLSVVNGPLKNLKQRLALVTTFALGPLLSACGGTPVTKFDWLATESAPKNYPMEIVRGYFIAPDGYSLYIPNEKTIHYGWGSMVSSHVVGPDLKPLPSRLEIEFFSYTENVFYQGEFDLPYDTIVRLFNEGYYSPSRKAHATYRRIVAGVAPGGSVAVWLLGVDKTTEVFFGKAEKTEDIPWTQIIDNPEITREDFVREEVEDNVSPEALKNLKQNGIPFDLWSSYRVRYPWQPLIIADHPPPFVNAIFYFNGEEDAFRYPLDEATASALRSVPRKVFYIWDNPEGKAKYLTFNFDEAETFAAFKKLSPDGTTPLKLEFHTRKLDGIDKFATQLSNEKESVVLHKMIMGRNVNR